MERDDPAKDRLAAIPPLCILRDDPGTNLHSHAEGKHTCENRASRYTAFEFLYLCTWFVHVEGPNDDKFWRGGEVPYWDGDSFDDVFVDGVDIVL